MRKNMKISVLLFCSGLFFYPAIGISQNRANVVDTVKIDEIIVTGTHVGVSRNSVPMAVSVIDRLQIEESDESALLPVLNGKVPGLFVTERGITGFGVAEGSAGQISIRGMGGVPTTCF